MNSPEGEINSRSGVDVVVYELALAKKMLAAIEEYERSAVLDRGVSVVIFGLRAKETSETNVYETRERLAKDDLSKLIRMRMSGVDNGGRKNEAAIAREIELLLSEVERLILVRNSVDGINFDAADVIENAYQAAIANISAIIRCHYSFGGSFEEYVKSLPLGKLNSEMEVYAPLLKAAALGVIKESASGAANDAAADLSAADSPNAAPVEPEAVTGNVVESVQNVTASRVVARINEVVAVRPQVKAVENCDIDSLRSDFAAWSIQRANAKAAGDMAFRRWRTDVFFADICKSLNISSYRKDRMDADADYREKIINEVKSNLKKIDLALVRTFEVLISR